MSTAITDAHNPELCHLRLHVKLGNMFFLAFLDFLRNYLSYTFRKAEVYIRTIKCGNEI